MQQKNPLEKILIEKDLSIAEIIEIIRKSPLASFNLEVCKGSPLFLNKTNLLVVLAEIEKSRKVVDIKTTDERGNNLLSAIYGKRDTDLPPAFLKTDLIGNVKDAKREKNPIKFKFRKPNFDGFGGAMKVLGVLLFLFFVLFSFIFAWWYIPQSNVELVLDSEILVKSVEVVVNPKLQQIDLEKKWIPSVILNITKTDTSSIPATGKSTIGDRAEGKVTIINKTEGDKSFAEGSRLFLDSNNEISYLLKSGVEVPRSSETSNTTLVYGTKTVDVIAENFGSRFNLEKDEDLVLDGYDKDKYYAKVENDIKGGTEKEVTAVSKNDIALLKTNMEGIVEKDALNSLRDKLVGDQILPDGGYKSTIVSEEFNKKVGEEASTLDLTQTVKIEGFVYAESDLQNLLKEVLKEFIPEKYSITGAEEKLEISEAIASGMETLEDKTEVLKMQVKVKSYVIPKVEEEDIRNNLIGQSVASAEAYLSRIPHVASLKIDLWPPLPGFLRTMPHIKSKIKIEIKHQ